MASCSPNSTETKNGLNVIFSQHSEIRLSRLIFDRFLCHDCGIGCRVVEKILRSMFLAFCFHDIGSVVVYRWDCLCCMGQESGDLRI